MRCRPQELPLRVSNARNGIRRDTRRHPIIHILDHPIVLFLLSPLFMNTYIRFVLLEIHRFSTTLREQRFASWCHAVTSARHENLCSGIVYMSMWDDL